MVNLYILKFVYLEDRYSAIFSEEKTNDCFTNENGFATMFAGLTKLWSNESLDNSIASFQYSGIKK